MCKIIPPQLQFALYTSCIYSFAEYLRHTAKATKKGRVRQGSLPPFRQKIPGNRPTPVFASLHQPLPLIISYLTYVLVVCFALAVALCSPSVSSVLILIIPQVSQRGHTCPCRCITTAYSSNSQTASHCKIWLTTGYPNMLGHSQARSAKLAYHTIKQAITHSKVAASSKA